MKKTKSLEIIESTEAMQKLMVLVDWKVLSIPQKWMISQIQSREKPIDAGLTYRRFEKLTIFGFAPMGR